MRHLVTPGIEALRPYETGKPIEELARELGVQNAGAGPLHPGTHRR
jgi:hypothetical protein